MLGRQGGPKIPWTLPTHASTGSAHDQESYETGREERLHPGKAEGVWPPARRRMAGGSLAPWKAGRGP